MTKINIAKLYKDTLHFIKTNILLKQTAKNRWCNVCECVCAISELTQDLFLLSEEFYTVDLVHID